MDGITMNCSAFIIQLFHPVKISIDSVNVVFNNWSSLGLLSDLALDAFLLVDINNCFKTTVCSMLDNSVIKHGLNLLPHVVSNTNLLLKVLDLLLHSRHLCQLLVEFQLLLLLSLFFFLDLSFGSSSFC